MKKENIFILENGDVLNVTKRKAEIERQQVEADAILVDGLGVGDVGNIVLRDRKLLSESRTYNRSGHQRQSHSDRSIQERT